MMIDISGGIARFLSDSFRKDGGPFWKQCECFDPISLPAWPNDHNNYSWSYYTTTTATTTTTTMITKVTISYFAQNKETKLTRVSYKRGKLRRVSSSLPIHTQTNKTTTQKTKPTEKIIPTIAALSRFTQMAEDANSFAGVDNAVQTAEKKKGSSHLLSKKVLTIL